MLKITCICNYPNIHCFGISFVDKFTAADFINNLMYKLRC